MTALLACDATAIKTPMTGVQNAVWQQVRALAEALPSSIAPLVITRHGSPLATDDGSVNGIANDSARALFAPDLTRAVPARIAWQQLALPRLLRQQHADALYAFAYTAPLRCPVPYILNVHDLIALEHPELCSVRNRWHQRCLLPHSIRHAAIALCSTTHGADLARRLLGIPPERLAVAPLGVDYDAFATPAPAPNLPSTRPYFLFVSNIEPKKDLDTLLDAYAVCADTTQTDLVIVGRAAWKSSRTIRRLQTWHGPGHVHWLHYVPQNDLAGLYQHALATVVPSLVEGFGLPILEAMAAGSPVIHSDHPAVLEAAGNAGLPFPVHDATALAAAMTRLSQSPALRQELASAGQCHARDLPWSRWGKTAAELVSLII